MYKIRNTVLIVIITLLAGCAPVTETIKLSKAEVRHEESIQKDLAKRSAKKKIPKKFKTDEYYISRLNRISAPIQNAAMSLCTKKKANHCLYEVKLAKDKVLNAWADGKKVWFTPTMLEFMSEDNDLAVIMAHEYSHNLQGHIDKKTANALLGLIVDVAISMNGSDTEGAFTKMTSQIYSQGFENEADYVGMYLLHKGGYNIDNVSNVWRKMAIQLPENIKHSYLSSHPSHPQRYLRMEKAKQEIYEKKSSGQPVVPTLKKK